MKTLATMSSTCVLCAELRIDSTQTFCFPIPKLLDEFCDLRLAGPLSEPDDT